MKAPTEAIERLTQGFYDHVLKTVTNRIKGRDFSLSDLPAMYSRLRSESETAQILIISSFLEEKVSELMKHQLHGVDSKADEERLFSGNGPLSSFANRLTLCYHLGWLSKGTLDKINRFRKVRNKFAHKAFRVSLSDHDIRDLTAPIVVELDRVFLAITEYPSEKDDDDTRKLRDRVARMSEGERIICGLACLIGSICRELVVFPDAHREKVRPIDLHKSLDLSQSVSSYVVESIFELLDIGPIYKLFSS